MSEVARNEDEDVRDALLIDDDPQEDAINRLIDEDAEVRAAVAAEIKQRLMNPPQPTQPQESPTASLQSEAAELRRKIDADEAFIDTFYAKPDSERNYTEFQQAQDRIRRNERSLREKEREEQRLVQNLNQSDAWVESWIGEAKLRDPNVGRYASTIKQLASQLPPAVLANREQLRNSLQHYVEPNAFKRYSMQNRQARRQDPRRDSAGSGAYEDSGDEEQAAAVKQDRFADATPQERDFLRRVGVIKDDAKKAGDGLVPIEDGYIIPIGRGRRNEGAR